LRGAAVSPEGGGGEEAWVTGRGIESH
jgi:hypothetical protein